MIAGRYTLEREIGRGGMGAVWLGRDEVLGREVALKRVGWAPGGSTPDLARAEREARLAARLNHPHVVAVYDLVVEGDEQWLVMEYVAGATLAELVQRDGPLSADAAAPIVRQAADALAAAHAAGIVHRDVKPSNILVGPDGQVKLSDFGIARAEADASLTQTGLVTGSPAYLSPEVASGQTAQPASDVWSLGATLFHALAGRPPYEIGENVLGALYRIVNEPPPRLADAGWLAPVLVATMSTDPASRWSTAQVRDFLTGGPADGLPAPLPVAAPVAAPVVASASVPAAEREPTRQMSRMPAAPAAPVAEAAAVGRRSRGGPLAIAGAAVVIVVLAVVAWMLGTGEDDPGGAGPSGGSSAPTTPTSSATPEVTADGMRDFVETYLATVTTDPAAAWQELTPAFQEASGNFGQYQKFWRGFRSAELVSARPDPGSMQISYTVAYEHDRGDSSTDDVTLTLEGTDGNFRIAAES
ncbi:serine/threonine-protein kinase [Nocardioides sp. YIM 152315]|uniref:serine/threonine-protein kinase n=1 Tax=Nocardioides sp. YIM 152315 TaxID=3031760 RepID=UPI0023DB3453|nr:serine/threonine-protein kinase [Nocardioides sp. YIM 152315]MDF1603800.1 serine/threonine-protein kinase [Nocardioides sp. YIM 152315]